jgi:hypothetical protein
MLMVSAHHNNMEPVPSHHPFLPTIHIAAQHQPNIHPDDLSHLWLEHVIDLRANLAAAPLQPANLGGMLAEEVLCFARAGLDTS